MMKSNKLLIGSLCLNCLIISLMAGGGIIIVTD